MCCGSSRPRECAILQYCQGVRRTRWWRRDERLVRYEVNAVTRAFTAKLTQTERYDLIEVPKFARREHETSSSRLLPCAPGALATNTEHRRLASLRRVASPVRCSLVHALRLSTDKNCRSNSSSSRCGSQEHVKIRSITFDNRTKSLP